MGENTDGRGFGESSAKGARLAQLEAGRGTSRLSPGFCPQDSRLSPGFPQVSNPSTADSSPADFAAFAVNYPNMRYIEVGKVKRKESSKSRQIVPLHLSPLFHDLWKHAAHSDHVNEDFGNNLFD